MNTLPKDRYFVPLDTLRFFAVFLVLIEHWLHTYDFVHDWPLGDLGVDIFFVISGFLITRILLGYRTKDEALNRGKGQSLKTFYMRRVLRIFPLYYAIVITTTLANHGLIREAFPYNMTYTTNFFIMDHGDWPGIFGHFWSLSVEEQFYLLWPFVILFIPRKWLLPAFAGFILTAVVYRYAAYDFSHSYVFTIVGTPGCFDAFAIGGILAYLALHHEKIMKRILSWWPLFLAVVLTYAYIKTTDISLNNPTLTVVMYRLFHAIVAFWIIGKLCYGNLGFLRPVLTFKGFLFLGKISYGMYLLHNFIPGFLMGLPLPENKLLRFPIYFIALVLAAWIALKIIENPFNKLKKHFQQ